MPQPSQRRDSRAQTRHTRSFLARALFTLYVASSCVVSLLPVRHALAHPPRCETHFLAKASLGNAPTPKRFFAKKIEASLYFNDLHGTATRYYSPDERKVFKINVRDGLLYNSRGEPLTIRDAIYVMEPSTGDLFVLQPGLLSPKDNPWWHHSSPLAGAEVAAAGNMTVENGLLKFINNESGHYSPELPFLKQVITRLEELGADLTNATIADHLGVQRYLKDLPNFTPDDLLKLERHNSMVELEMMKDED